MENKQPTGKALLIIVILAIVAIGIFAIGDFGRKSDDGYIGSPVIDDNNSVLPQNTENNENTNNTTPTPTNVTQTFMSADFSFQYPLASTVVEQASPKGTYAVRGYNSGGLDEVDVISYAKGITPETACAVPGAVTVDGPAVFGNNLYTKCYSAVQPGSTTFILQNTSGGAIVITVKNKVNATTAAFIDLASVKFQ
ncbi:hypothetical protein IPF86_00620 [Candidatus Nomurabacteria bacterium]|jgi:hypothetical protein|nr:MAG: hypothetical protein IPF86_00620 [Candidatus Nomurabacteria bacterium]